MPSCLIEGLARTLDVIEVPLDQEAFAGSAEVTTLLDALTLVPDPRRRQGCRYAFTGLLSVTAVAVMCGARSLAGIVRWAHGAAPTLLCALGLPDAADGRVPATTTLGRALAKTDGDALDDALTGFTEALAADPLDDVVDSGVKSPATDGKTVCGAIDAEGKQLHLLSVFRPETGTVAAQRAMRDKGCEVTRFPAVLDTLDSIAGHIVTADALHCQRSHAAYLHERGAFYYFPVLGNQPTLFTVLDGPDWENTPLAHEESERNRGRTETRSLEVLPTPEQADFPHAVRAVLIERTTTGRGDGKIHCYAELGITSAPTATASATDLARIARDHWGVEAMHHVRDVTYDEDASHVRSGSTPRAIAAFRNSPSASPALPDSGTSPPRTTTTGTTLPTRSTYSVSPRENERTRECHESGGHLLRRDL
ncbi:ISAs1 family transposase [Streptomyces olivoreticuli]